MSLDIGGTSADVAIIFDGEPQYGVGERIGDFKIFIPSVSRQLDRAGGGSIAWVDELGVLKVGPESAGSNPGPGLLRPRRHAPRPSPTPSSSAASSARRSRLQRRQDRSRPRAPGRRPLAEELGVERRGSGRGHLKVCASPACISECQRLVSRFGVDPREFAPAAFGGAGPMIGRLLAREVGMREVLVPPTPGRSGALGGLVADLKSDFIRTIYRRPRRAGAMPGRASRRAPIWKRRRALAARRAGLHRRAAHHLVGRYALPRPVLRDRDPLDRAWIDSGDLAAIADGFHRRARALYGHADRAGAGAGHQPAARHRLGSAAARVSPCGAARRGTAKPG